MLALISPAKTLDFSPSAWQQYTQPQLLDYTEELVSILRTKSIADIKTLMKLSDKLAELNYQRFLEFTPDFVLNTNAKQAIFAFKGDVYTGLDIKSLSTKEVEFISSHLLILSGLYGVLRPLDLMMPYRLEMGTRLGIIKHKNLYQFWGSLLAETINQHEQQEVVNLASNEYFKAVDTQKLQARLIDIDFKEYKNGAYKTIGIHAKRARGAMVRFMAQHGVQYAEELKSFGLGGYAYHPELSQENTWVFSRTSSQD